MNEKRLAVKDLINIGIFTALYIVITILVASFIFLPILQLFVPVICALLMAPVYLLFVARTQKPFCITVLGLIVSLVIGLVAFGNIICFVINFAVFVIAELVAFLGKYKSFKINAISYIVSSYWLMGQDGLYWFMQDYIYDLSVKSGYSIEAIDTIISFVTIQNLFIILLSTGLAASISVLFARLILKKHFIRAGIV